MTDPDWHDRLEQLEAKLQEFAGTSPGASLMLDGLHRLQVKALKAEVADAYRELEAVREAIRHVRAYAIDVGHQDIYELLTPLVED
jgi:hypothetical protein